MRFRTTHKPRGLVARKHQIRLTLMMAGLAVILLAGQTMGRPAFWSRMFPDESQATEQGPLHETVAQTVFRPDFSENGAAEQLPNELQEQIQDDVLGVRAEEWKPWAMSLQQARDLEQRRESGDLPRQPRAKYALLMDAPDKCRGRAFTVSGTLRRMTKSRVTNRNLGEFNVIDAWLTLPDSGDGLVHVVSTAADSDLPLGNEFGTDPPEVTLTGYFFKREAYSSNAAGGLSIAPLFLAASISRTEVPEANVARSDQLTPWLGWLAALTCAAMGLVIWSFLASDAAHRGDRTHELTRLPASPSFDGVDAESPYETLEQLEAAAESLPTEYIPGSLTQGN